MEQSASIHLFIISGRSGSGKSCALHALEDLGYYCVDNLPPVLIPGLIAQFLPKPGQAGLNQLEKLAVGIDVRSLTVSDTPFEEVLEQLNKIQGLSIQIIYLDAVDQTLLRRFNETRRKHPLSNAQTPLKEALSLERLFLSPLQTDATLVIDTTSMNLHQLRTEMHRLVGTENARLVLLIQSFGFKYGLPTDSDLVFDVRCLPNPHWVPHLRALTGQDKPVVEFLQEHPDVQTMIRSITTFVEQWLPHYQANNRRYVTVSIGCTGGQHRSVFIAGQLEKHFETHWSTQLRHRQLTPAH